MGNSSENHSPPSPPIQREQHVTPILSKSVTTAQPPPKPFCELPWNERAEYLGDTSEAAFEVLAGCRGLAVERIGMDKKSPLTYRDIHPFIRLRPDYLVQDQGEDPHWLEVKAVKDDGLVKIKQDSLEAGQHWQLYHRFKFFFWNKTKHVYATTWLDDLTRLIKKHRITTTCFEVDGNQFYPVPAKLFTWHKLPAIQHGTA